MKIVIIFCSILSILTSESIFCKDNRDIAVAFSPSPAPQNLILKSIKQAKESIDICMFVFTDETIADALCYMSKRRKIKIKLLVDKTQENQSKHILEKLYAYGVTVIRENLSAKVHTKLTIIDKKKVLTGSYNWTAAARLHNYEDLVIFEDENIVSKYNKMVEKLFEFGTTLKLETNKYKKLKIKRFPKLNKLDSKYKKMTSVFKDVKNLDVFFPPKRLGKKKLIKDIKNAKKSLTIAMYYFTDDTLEDIILEKSKTLESLNIILENDYANDEVYEKLKDQKISLKKIGKNTTNDNKDNGIMHLKIAIIDDEILWTGSTNWTYGAFFRNAEDMLRIESKNTIDFYKNYIDKMLK